MFSMCMGREIVRRLGRVNANWQAARDERDPYGMVVANRHRRRLERLAAYIDHRVLRSVSWDEYGIGYTPTEWANGGGR